MKKMLRRIAVLVCIATLFVMPASSAFALVAPPATLVNDFGTVRSYQYPYPIVLQPGDSMFIAVDPNNPTWDVPANSGFGINAFFQSSSNGGNVTAHIYRLGGPNGTETFMQYNVNSLGGAFPIVNYSSQFYIVATNDSNYPVTISGFLAWN